MIKYEGLSYDLDSLLEFHVLKKLLEALLKKQKLHDIILYGPDLENIISSPDDIQNTDNNQKSEKEKIAAFGLIKEFIESQNKLKENSYAVKDLRERIEILEEAIKEVPTQSKPKNYANRLSKSDISNKNINDEKIEKKNPIKNEDNKEKTIKENEKSEKKEEKEIPKENYYHSNRLLSKEKVKSEEFEKKLKELEEKIEDNSKKCENNENLINTIQQNENELTQNLKNQENIINDLLKNLNNTDDSNKGDNNIFDSFEKKLTTIIENEIREKSTTKFNNFVLEYNKEKDRINSLIEKNIKDVSSLLKKLTNVQKSLDELPQKSDINSIKDQITSLNASIEDSVNKKELNSLVQQFEIYEKEIGKFKAYKVDQQKVEQKFKDQLTNMENSINHINKNINSFSTLLGNKSFYEVLDMINTISTKMVDIDDYNKTMSTINRTLTDLKIEVNDHNRSIDDIMPRIEKILTKEDLEKVENTANELIAKQNSNSITKFADKKEIQKTLHSIETQIKIMKTEFAKEKENKLNTCMLSSKPVGGYKCASCETYIGELKESFQYLPWNKYPYQDNNTKPYNIGTGYSRVLQSMSIEHLKTPSHTKCEKLKHLSLVNSVEEHSMSFDGCKTNNNDGLVKYSPNRSKECVNSFSMGSHKNIPVLRVVSTKHLKSMENVEPMLQFHTEQKFNADSPKKGYYISQRMSMYESKGRKKNLKGIHTNLMKNKTKDSYYANKKDPFIMKPVKSNMHS